LFIPPFSFFGFYYGIEPAVSRSGTRSAQQTFSVPLGKDTSRGHAPLHAEPTLPDWMRSSLQFTFKVCGTLFYMILLALLSVRNKLLLALKYFECNTIARKVPNVHVCF